MEWIPTEARAVVGTINGYCYTLGQFVLAGIAFGLPHWRWLQLVVSLPFFFFFLYSWYGDAEGRLGGGGWARRGGPRLAPRPPSHPVSPLFPRLFVESARWQVISGRPDLALKGLRKVARVNGRKEEGDKLSEEVRSLPDLPDPIKSLPDPPRLPSFSPRSPISPLPILNPTPDPLYPF